MTILAKIGSCRQKPADSFAGKNYFCQSGFYRGKKRFFPPSGKNLPTPSHAQETCTISTWRRFLAEETFKQIWVYGLMNKKAQLTQREARDSLGI